MVELDVDYSYFKHFSNKNYDTDYLFKHFNNHKKYVNYNKYKSNSNIIKCGTIILDKDKTKILLVQNNYLKTENNIELWGIPKGARKDKETYADCAMRETYEETGINIKLKNNMIRVKIRNTYYFIYILDKKYNIFIPVDKREIYKVKWFDIKNIPHNKVNIETKLFIKQKYNFIKKINNSNIPTD